MKGQVNPYLAPCVNEDAQDHFSRTVKNPITAEDYQEYTDRDYGSEVYLWGTRDGNERYWKQIQKNDILLFYPETGMYTHAAKVLGTELNEQLGAEVYTSTEDPFSHLIYLDEPFRIELPSQEFHRLIGYGRDFPINFTIVGDERLREIRSQFGSLRAYLKEQRKIGPKAPGDEVDEAQEDLEVATTTEPNLTEENKEYTERQARARSAAFRRKVREHYAESCAICDTRRETPSGTPEVEAAHIYPRSENGADDIRNGIALCKLHHWAVDSGWISFTNDFEIMVKDAPDRDGYEEFSRLEGETLNIPKQRQYQPHTKFLQEHRNLHGFPHK